jgi:hypothetical protein
MSRFKKPLLLVIVLDPRETDAITTAYAFGFRALVANWYSAVT